jgi:arginase
VTDLEAIVREWVIIGVPSSAGAHHAGQERAPAALRAAGMIGRLRAAGLSVADAGDLPGTAFAVDHDHPRARSLAAVTRVARQVADAVADVVADGRLPLLIGGDCTITLGVIAGFRRAHPDAGLVYVDGDADVSTPESTGSGILDSMGVAHLLGQGAPELARLAGESPLLQPHRLALVGGDPRETDLAGRQFLAELGVSFQEGPALAADPVGVARRALDAVTSRRGTSRPGPLVLHFDVDVVDSGDLPLANFPHYGSGVLLEHVVSCLRALLAHKSVAGLVLTEVNPTHDADGALVSRYLDGLVSAMTGS